MARNEYTFQKGHKHLGTPEGNKKISEALKKLYREGKRKPATVSLEVRNKISETLKRKGIEPPHWKGEKSPVWKGGISIDPYPSCWTESLKRLIRKRDNNICQKCFVQWEKGKRLLHVHHIDFNKNNCSTENLITLCHSCHKREHNKAKKIWKL